MATIINPITTVFINNEEMESGEFDRFPFKYILEESGDITYRTSFTCGRYIAANVAEIPGLATGKKPSINEFQPLAHGVYIPYEFLGQIEQFFKDVMKLRNGSGNFEAQTFVVWNDSDREYRIVIPEQEVSQTRVSYDIQDILGENDHIIMDIHSHNTMGAFYSGTDNADDKKNSWISGVMGKLNTDKTEMVFRFNDGTGNNYPLNIEDIFYTEEFETPKEWLDKVKVPTYAARHNANKPRGRWEGGKWVASSSAAQTTYVNPMSSMEDLFTDEDDDSDVIYDAIADSINEIDPIETRNVLNASSQYLSNPDFCPTLTDRELAVFTEITAYDSYFKTEEIIDTIEEISRGI